MSRHYLVTGGAGFIGSHLLDVLVARGDRATVLDDLSTGRRDNLPATTAEDDPQASARPGMKRFTRESKHSGAVRLVVGDVRDAAVMDRELDGAAAVIHMACGNLRDSLGDPMRSHEINATGTLVACLAAPRQGAERFLYVSSSEVYGTARFNPMTEEHPLVPTTVYAAAKAAGELSAMACMRTYGLPVSVVRLFNVYGPRANPVGSGAGGDHALRGSHSRRPPSGHLRRRLPEQGLHLDRGHGGRRRGRRRVRRAGFRGTSQPRWRGGRRRR